MTQTKTKAHTAGREQQPLPCYTTEHSAICLFIFSYLCGLHMDCISSEPMAPVWSVKLLLLPNSVCTVHSFRVSFLASFSFFFSICQLTSDIDLINFLFVGMRICVISRAHYRWICSTAVCEQLKTQKKNSWIAYAQSLISGDNFECGAYVCVWVRKSFYQLWNKYYETDVHVFHFRSYRTSGVGKCIRKKMLKFYLFRSHENEAQNWNEKILDELVFSLVLRLLLLLWNGTHRHTHTHCTHWSDCFAARKTLDTQSHNDQNADCFLIDKYSVGNVWRRNVEWRHILKA